MSGFNFGSPNTGQQAAPTFGSTTSGFSLGGNTQSTPTAAANLSFSTPKNSGFNFGPTAATTASSGFGQTMATPQASTGFAFGTPTATVQPQQQQAPSTLSFGAPQQPQAMGALSFGAQQPQQPAFGAQQTQQPAFGAQQTQQPAFGAQQTQQPAFGAQQTQQPAFGAQQTQQPAFGTQQPQQSTFGALQQQQQQPPAFGAQQTAFGAPQTTIPTNTVQPLSSIAQSAPASQPQAAGGFSFGAPAATTTAASLSFPMPAASTAQTQPASTGFGFGQPAAPMTATVAPVGFGLSAASAAPNLTMNPLTTATPSTGLSFGQPSSQSAPLFGAQPTQQSGGLLGALTAQVAPTVTSAAPQSIGLGGIDMNKTQPKAVEGKSESTKVKETQVPKEIIQTVDDFKAYVKQQKTLSSDIIRTTDRKLKSVTEEIQRLNCSVQETSNDVDNNKLAIKLLRSDTSKVIQHADMVQRTHETPSGLQFENVMPQIYFNELIHKYENDMLTLKHQVELTEKHLQSLSNPQNFSAQDLKRGLHQIHESFIALAGRLQETHMKVEGQKEQYLNLRKFMLRDTTNVFEIEQDKQMTGNASKVQFGPNPFTNSMMGGGMNISNQSMAKQQWPANQSQQQPPANNSFFGSSSLGNTSFGLKKF